MENAPALRLTRENGMIQAGTFVNQLYFNALCINFANHFSAISMSYDIDFSFVKRNYDPFNDLRINIQLFQYFFETARSITCFCKVSCFNVIFESHLVLN